MNIRKIRNGIILISVGIVLLLNNLDYVGWSVWWSILKLWPIFLVAWGIELVFRHSKLSFLALFSPLLWCLAILGPALLGEQKDFEIFPLSKQYTWQVEKQTNIKQVTAVIDVKGGELKLSGGSQNIADCDLTYFWEKPECSWSVEDSHGILEINQKDKIWFPFVNGSDEHEVKIAFSNSIPLDLQIFSKVSAADLDLSQLNLKNLDLNLKVNSTTVKLPLRPGQLDCKVKSKIGHLKLKVPKEAGLAIENLAKLSSTSFSHISLRHSAEGFKTPNYQKASSKINLILRGKIVQFEIETY
ncbi:MAG: hypothetical protein A2145_02265 [candidate division Zixibacteria bacterium RBG_16_40_9]|nr:MAG: hypothetical protein A2145_02265 [candidate division Zixibacteria bacterium RBG_16_40_9]